AAEHLIQSGCDLLVPVVHVESGRERELVLNAAQTAACRYGRTLAGPIAPEHFMTDVSLLLSGRSGTPAVDRARVGLICIGAAALRSVLVRQQADSAAQPMPLVAICEPGDTTAAEAGVTAYECAVDRIVERAVELVTNARAGSRPREILIAGAICGRQSRGARETCSPTRSDGALPHSLADAVG